MTSPAERHRGDRGFTLIEVLVVLVILGLAAALVLGRGSPHSQTLELRAAGAEIAGALRLARTRAIVSSMAVSVLFDPEGGIWRVDGSAPHSLPPRIVTTIVGTADPVSRGRMAAIRFSPDGSASGGRIDLFDGVRRVRIGVDWLTGRVSLDEGA